MACPTENEFVSYVQGSWQQQESRSFEEHLDTCADCRVLLSHLAKSILKSSTWRSVDGSLDVTTAGSAGRGDTDISPGSSVDRYTILRRVGAGAMGVVYAAYDSQLDRKIALKILTKSLSQDSLERFRQRVLDEAKAMARVSHRNVIVVHDVGHDVGHGVGGDDHIYYIAMEFIDGPTLAQWLQGSRSVQQIIDVFVEAGKGLAAAHGCGVVHRDFKPENVLVGPQGRVCVTDFGLAQSFMPTPDGGQDSHSCEVTGTPIYMSPEQLLGRAADARSDQYSFCVALYQALYRQHPFAASNIEELIDRVTTGTLEPLPATAAVPRRIQQVLQTGLQVKPEQRFASMGELLQKLGGNRKSRAPLYMAAGITAVMITILAVMWSPLANQQCTGAAQKMEGIWDVNSKNAKTRALQKTSSPQLLQNWDKLSQTLDNYAQRWQDMYTETCEATVVHGDQSQLVLEARMRCLDFSRSHLSALTAHLTSSPTLPEKALQAAYRLPDLERCSRSRVGTAKGEKPIDAATQKRLQQLQADLAQVNTLLSLGELESGKKLGLEVLSQLEEIGHLQQHRPFLLLRAQAHGTMADIREPLGQFEEAEKNLYQSLWAYKSAGNAEGEARSWIALAFVVGCRKLNFEEGETFAQNASATVASLRDNVQLRGEVEHIRGALLWSRGKFPEAQKHIEKSLLLLQTLPDMKHGYASTLHNYALQLFEQGQYPAAIKEYKKAIAASTEAFGKNHSETALSISGLGNVYVRMGQLKLALEHYRIAEKIYVGPPQHSETMNIWGNIATVLVSQNKLELASEYIDRSLELQKKLLPPEHLDIHNNYNNRAHILYLQKRYTESEKYLHKALDIAVANVGEDHFSSWSLLMNLGDVKHKQGNYDQALEYVLRAEVILKEGVGEHHLYFGHLYTIMGQIYLDRGQANKALQVLKKAYAERETLGEPKERGETIFALAKATLATGSTKAAQQYAKQANQIFTEAEAVEEQRQVEKWMTQFKILSPEDKRGLPERGLAN